MFGELYILYEVVAFVFFYLAIDKRRIVFSIMGMILFFSLALMSVNVEPIYMPSGRAALQLPELNILIFLNFGFGLLCFMYSVWLYLYEMKEGLEGRRTEFEPT